MEPYFADGCPLIEMEKGDRPGKKERENTKKSRGAEKKTVFQGAAVLYATASAAQCCDLEEGRSRAIVTALSDWELLLSAFHPSKQKAVG